MYMDSRNIDTSPHGYQGVHSAYDLLQTLGRRGFSKVFLNRHIHLPTRAAVKVLRASLVDEKDERFRHEAQTVAQLQAHQHIVRVIDYNVQDRHPYIVMGYAPNGSLRQPSTYGEKVLLPAVVSYVTQLAFVLQHIYKLGMMHHDIKPEYMLLGVKGQVLISGLGKRYFILGTLPKLGEDQLSIDKMRDTFLKVGSHHASLVSLAYKCIKELECIKEYLEAA